MRRWVIGTIVTAGVGAAAILAWAVQGPAIQPIDESRLREYAGVYRWEPGGFVYLQPWNELTPSVQLHAFDESGEVRALYPTERDRFFAGPAAAVSSSIESRIDFQRGADGRITSFTWRRDGGSPRVARRVDVERHEDVRFANGGVQLSGTLISPRAAGKHPAVILVHGSGPATREWMVPFARFLVRRGMAVLGYDKRGVGGSTGDWTQASFDDLAGDAVAAFEYLKGRPDIEANQIGLMGVSQAGWIMPIAATRTPGFAFLISVSGAAVPGSETTIDHAQREMVANGMKLETIDAILGIMKAQYEFVRTGQRWDEYAAARANLAKRIGNPPDSFPATPDHPHFQFLRRVLLYDPAPTIRRLQVPTLAIFGELDNNILAEKNKAAWEAALKAGGHPDYTLKIIPRANHIHLEAKVGNNKEMPTLQRFVPDYFTTIETWLAKRIRGFGARP